jgi:penicillin-binding protein 1A
MARQDSTVQDEYSPSRGYVVSGVSPGDGRRKRIPPGRPRGGGSRGGFLARLAFVILAWLIVILGLGGFWLASTLPDISGLGTITRHASVTLRSADGVVIATYGDLYGEVLKYDEMPKALTQAVVATEDRRFFEHFGLDPIGLARAAIANFRAGTVVQGGSTITQQLAKNLFLTPDRTLHRKLQEAMLALWLEKRFTKKEILEIYLNRVYLGAGAWGVDAAAKRYFGKSARDLGIYESATLAGLLKAPTKYSPAGDPQKTRARTAQVLLNMVEAHYLTADQAVNLTKQAALLNKVPANQAGRHYFGDWIQDEIAAAGYQGDVVVTTTLDSRMQAAAEAAVANILAKDGTKAAAGQAALVAMSPDGAVRAMVGGRDYRASQFNRATQAYRQPGSAFKPFVYLAGLEAGLSSSDEFIDQPIRIGNWEPHDFEPGFRGAMTLSEALAQSINTIAVQVAQRAGFDNVVAVAHRLGISSALPIEPSVALGSGDVTLIDLTASYCAFASGGIGAWPYGVSEIRDTKGKVLWQREGGGPGRLIRADIAGEMNGLLTGVITHGTGRAAQIDRPAAGKTGTTSDFRDALFVGYTPDLVAGVWVGNDDDGPMNKVTGGSLPAHIWHDFMLAALKGRPPVPLPLSGSAPIEPPKAQPAVQGEESFRDLLDQVSGSPADDRRRAILEGRDGGR